MAQDLGRLGELLPEPLLLVSLDGTIVSTNRAASLALQLGDVERGAVTLRDFTSDLPERLDAYLRACARTTELLPGSLTVKAGGGEREYHVQGGRYAGQSGQAPPLVLLRLVPKAATVVRFTALNDRIEELGRELARRLRAEAALQASEARFRALMEQAPFSVQIFSPDGRTVSVNRAWNELWGATADQISDYNVLQDPQLAAKGVLSFLQRAFAGEAVAIPAIEYDPHQTIPNVSRHERAARWVSAVAYPLKDVAGCVKEVVLVHEDVTARAWAEGALRESEEKLRLLADTIPQLAWMARSDGHIFWYNRRWYEYTGTTLEQMQGWGWQSVHDPTVLPQVVANWTASITSGEPFEMVFPLRCADGTFRPFLTRVNPLRNSEGRITYWCGTNTDIGELKHMEEALREADRRKDEFLATLAHELRNPLAPICNALQVLKMPRVDALTAQHSREIIERQVQHLVRLIDDLLDVSRVMRGRIDLRKETVDLSTVLARAVEIAQPAIDSQRHRLDINIEKDPLLVDADAVRVSQVVANLLTNAARYTDPEGHITVIAKRDGANALIRVRDNGVGIAPELLESIFGLFIQANPGTARAIGGLGIGLTLVRNLVELHGGSVQAYSAGVGMGAEFSVRLPLSQQLPVEPAAPPETLSFSAQTGRRLLIVDDNKDAADSLALLLRHQGYDVDVAHDGAAALQLAASFRPALILLDIGMPEMDGYEVARRLRAMGGFERTLIAALTGWGNEEDRRRSAEAGFDCHLVKPPQPAALGAVLARLEDLN